MNHFAITTGDTNGVGLEVTAKALEILGPQKGARFVLYRSSQSENRQLRRIDKKFSRVTVSSLDEALLRSSSLKSSRVIFDIEHPQAAPFWVKEAGEGCVSGHLKGLVTAPLSKTLIQQHGFAAKGHTEILQTVSNTKNVHMVFIGKFFNVLLATGHLPLSEVSSALTRERFTLAIDRALKLRNLLPSNIRKKPVAVLGLNPHAGENGILGHEELEIFSSVLRRYPEVKGPLSPDAAFQKQNWKTYSIYIACYHDQGLIPFKMIHGTSSGYHLTFGLPFIRTSVDHGTAFDIYGKNKADGSSMLDAIRACINLSR